MINDIRINKYILMQRIILVLIFGFSAKLALANIDTPGIKKIPIHAQKELGNDTCTQNFTLSNEQRFAYNFSIIKAEKITTSGEVIVQKGENLVLRASQEIKLLTGFLAHKGSNFLAYIDPVSCPSKSAGSTIPPYEQTVGVYPNPNNGRFTIVMNSDEMLLNYDVTIITCDGKVIVRKLGLTRPSVEVIIPGAISGTYFVKIYDRKKQLSVVKAIIVL